MNTPTSPDEAEVIIEDPSDGQRHTFTGATEADAMAKADRFFGVDEGA